MKTRLILLSLLSLVACSAQETLTELVDPFLGTATLWEKEDLGYERHRKTRTWGAETFPGAALPNSMVQATPVTQYHSGSGYQYEDSTICAFAHSCKGHWNLCHLPMLPVRGDFTALDYASPFSHRREEAHPGYYRVYLERYGTDVELTVTPRCAFHRYTFVSPSDSAQLLLDLTRSNERVVDFGVERVDAHAFRGWQHTGETMYFYAVSDREVVGIRELRTPRPDGKGTARVWVVDFAENASGKGAQALNLRIGFSFSSCEKACGNLAREMAGKDFGQLRRAADRSWEELLSRIRVKGGSHRERALFYSNLYRSQLWPCLRSDCGEEKRYTDPSFWDDHRNKLILLGLLQPDVACDVVKSITERGEKNGGYMPTFFHGDHASTFVAGLWGRGIRDFDLDRAYRLLLKNATVPGRGGRRYLEEYLERGWISDKDSLGIPYWKEFKAGVHKTLEYAYDDYATALLARELGDTASERRLMARSRNYRHLFDASTGFWRGRNDRGEWLKDFDPYYPYFQHMWRESNAWNLLFYPPHDVPGLFSLYGSGAAASSRIEAKLDSLFSEPWRGYEVENLTGFIGQYCHGNQPGHHLPFVYSLIGKPRRSQEIIDACLDRFYDMGADRLAYAGMDDAGEMSSWYVLSALGLYTWSPADPEYLLTRPLFKQVVLDFPGRPRVTLCREAPGRKHRELKIGSFVPDSLLRQGGVFSCSFPDTL